MMPTPYQLMRAHQYLYYVRCESVWTDYEYDRFCARHGLFGKGGSDLARDYTPEEIALAEAQLVHTIPFDEWGEVRHPANNDDAVQDD